MSSGPPDAGSSWPASPEEEWLWGWDPTPGIVSVWAEHDGRAQVWRRLPGSLQLVRDEVRFRPWVVLASLEDLAHLGQRLRPERSGQCSAFSYRELEGPGELRFLVHAEDGRALTSAVLEGASRRLGRPLRHVRELGAQSVLVLPPEDQYLAASGRTYFRGLQFDDLRRLQFDLETTGLDAEHDRIFLAAVRAPDGTTELLECATQDIAGEAELIRKLAARIRALDPDVIENHNLHGFDLPFLARRAQLLGVPLALGRAGPPGLRQRAAARGTAYEGERPGGSEDGPRRFRYTVPGRELIDTLDAVRRHDFSARDLPGLGLKAVARHFGLAGPAREHIPGARVHEVYLRDPERVRRYARDDVHEAAGLARLLGGAAFALARIAPRRYERLADAGAATGVIDPMLVRAYLRSSAALPAHQPGDGTSHNGAALHLFASGVAHRVVKADVASLYPSLMRQYRIGPARDRLGVMLAVVDTLVLQRLAAKARAKTAPVGSAQRHTDEALSAAMKLVVNSAYGYLGAVGLTRFADVHAANEVTRRGREVLSLLCRELSQRGVTLLEADTDGVYFAVPAGWTEADERRVVSEVAALLPEKVRLEFEGRYAAMLSHEPKNYALMPYAGPVVLRGVAFRSSRAEPFGEEFLRRAIERLLACDIAGLQQVWIDTVTALRRRALPTLEVASHVRLTKTPEEYLEVRPRRRELPYEAVLGAGRTQWRVGEHVRVYRAAQGRAGLVPPPEDEEPEDAGAGGAAAAATQRPSAPASTSEPGTAAAGTSSTPGTSSAPGTIHGSGTTARDPRDYDAEYYVRLLRETFASRLARALTAEDFATVFADPEQPSLFARPLSGIQPILTVLSASERVPTAAGVSGCGREGA